jgi:hypothetical protein
LDGSLSPDGLSLVLTDDSGRFTSFNVVGSESEGSCSRGLRITSSANQESRIAAWMKDQYFANDYNELFYDSNGYCVERGIRQPPHLAPRGMQRSFGGALGLRM